MTVHARARLAPWTAECVRTATLPAGVLADYLSDDSTQVTCVGCLAVLADRTERALRPPGTGDATHLADDKQNPLCGYTAAVVTLSTKAGHITCRECLSLVHLRAVLGP